MLERDAAATRLAEPEDFVQPAIRDASGQLIGTMYFKLASVEDKTGEIGWLLDPRFQGQGYAREAAALLLDLAFGELGLHRVYAELDPRNAASVALCLRLGMRHEAHFREHMWFKGDWADTGIYAILEHEWRGRADADPAHAAWRARRFAWIRLVAALNRSESGMRARSGPAIIVIST